MNQEVSKILDIVCEKYPEIDTIVIFGSANHLGWNPESDIDLFFIDDSLSDGRIDLEINNIRIEIQTDSFAGVENCLKNEYGRLLNRNVSNMIATSQTVRCKSSERFEGLKAAAESTLASKTTFDDEDAKMWRYSIEDYLDKAAKDLKRGDSVAFYFDTHYVIQNATELVLAKSGNYFPQPKNLAGILEKIAPSFLACLREFMTENDLNRKLEILKKTKNF